MHSFYVTNYTTVSAFRKRISPITKGVLSWIHLFSCHGIIYMHGVPSYSRQLQLKMIYFSKHFNSQQSGKPELSSFFKGGIIMTEVQYSTASFLHSAPKPSEQLVYMTSAAFGKNWAYTLHSHSFAEVFFVTSGEGVFYSNDAEIPIRKNSLVLINPGTPHTERSSGPEPLTYMIMGIDNLFFQFLDNRKFQFHIYALEEFEHTIMPVMNLMLEETKSRQQSSLQICQHYMSVFFLKIQRLIGDRLALYTADSFPPECAAVKDYIKLHFAEDITLDTLAEFSGFNKYYLSRIFSKTYGIAPINYLLERRILNSEELLKTTDFSISQISRLVGFSSANYFSQSFKRYTGMTPLSYRETHFI